MKCMFLPANGHIEHLGGGRRDFPRVLFPLYESISTSDNFLFHYYRCHL